MIHYVKCQIEHVTGLATLVGAPHVLCLCRARPRHRPARQTPVEPARRRHAVHESDRSASRRDTRSTNHPSRADPHTNRRSHWRSDNTRTLRHTGHPGVTSDSSTVRAQPDSNTNGSVDPRRHRSGRYAARHGRWQIIKDPLGVKGSGLEPMSQIADDLRRGARGHTSLECGSS